MLDALAAAPTQDEDRPSWEEIRRARSAFRTVRNAELAYGAHLRRIAKHIADIVRGLKPDDVRAYDALQRMLEQYSLMLRPWAASVARSMLAEVNQRDKNAWRKHGQAMGIQLKREFIETPLGDEVSRLLDQQIDLITSLPRDAARRVHEIATGTLYTGARPDVVVREIMRTGLVTQHRAEMIAQTEVSRAASTFAMVRAKKVGSPGYIWRTARDFRVRPNRYEMSASSYAALNTLAMGSHRRLEGTYHRWDDPPVVDPSGVRGHPGTWIRCRCWADPVLPDVDTARRSSG